jgi:hypothetical protein
MLLHRNATLGLAGRLALVLDIERVYLGAFERMLVEIDKEEIHERSAAPRGDAERRVRPDSGRDA